MEVIMVFVDRLFLKKFFLGVAFMFSVVGSGVPLIAADGARSGVRFEELSQEEQNRIKADLYVQQRQEEERDSNSVLGFLPERILRHVPRHVHRAADAVVRDFLWQNLIWRMSNSLLFGIQEKLIGEGVTRLKDYIMTLMSKPDLVMTDCTPRGLTTDSFIFSPEVEQRIQQAVKSFNNVREGRKFGDVFFEDMLLYGPPGTGKTEIIRTIASMTGARYFEISGKSLAAATKREIELLLWKIKLGGKPTIVLIDECDFFLGADDEDERSPLGYFITETSKPSKHVMYCYTTNYPEKINFRMHRRIPNQIKIDPPAKPELMRVIKLYRDHFFVRSKGYSPEQREAIELCFNDNKISGIADKIQGFSPDEVKKMVNSMKSYSVAQNGGMLTPDIIDKAVERFIAGKNAQKGWVAQQALEKGKDGFSLQMTKALKGASALRRNA
jgi:hypothetical protein